MARKTSSRSKELRIGIVGCGHIGNWHAKCLKQIPGVQVAAVGDVDEKLGAALAAKEGPGCEHYANPLELIQQADIDAVYLCVPPMAHGAYEKAAVARKLPLFIEKPITPSLAEGAEDLQDPAEEPGG